MKILIYIKWLMLIYVRMVKVHVSFKNGDYAFTKMHVWQMPPDISSCNHGVQSGKWPINLLWMFSQERTWNPVIWVIMVFLKNHKRTVDLRLHIPVHRWWYSATPGFCSQESYPARSSSQAVTVRTSLPDRLHQRGPEKTRCLPWSGISDLYEM